MKPFKPGRELTTEQRAGAIVNGESWEFWRFDSDHHPWYKLCGTITTEQKTDLPEEGVIRGVPKQAALIGVDEDTLKTIRSN